MEPAKAYLHNSLVKEKPISRQIFTMSQKNSSSTSPVKMIFSFSAKTVILNVGVVMIYFPVRLKFVFTVRVVNLTDPSFL